jgi:invasion protein IalB
MYIVILRAVVAGALLAVSIGETAAQQPAPPAAQPQTAPQSSQPNPQRTTATYDDWVVRCEIQAGPPQQKICDMAQLAQVQGQANPISRVGIAKPAKGEAVKLVIQLPVNVSVPGGVKIQADDKDPGLVAPFKRCIPAGCFAEVDLKDDMMKKLRAAAQSWKMQLKDGGEHEVAIPLSLKGFAQAYDALLKQ